MALLGTCFKFLDQDADFQGLPVAGGIHDQPWDFMGVVLQVQAAAKAYLSGQIKKAGKK